MNPETPESPAFGDVSAAVEQVRAPGIMSDAAIEMLGLNTPCRAAMLDASMAGDGAPSERVICETLQLDTLYAFRAACHALKQAEEALIAARQVYAEAVKALSEEAVK